MLPDLTVLLALLLGLGAMTGEPTDPVRTLAGTAACVLVFSALSRMAGARALRALDENEPALAAAGRRWTVAWALIGWALCLSLFGWGAFVGDAIPRLWWLGRYAILFLPAGILFATAWIAQGPIDARVLEAQGLTAPEPTVRHALFAGLRRNALVLFPIIAIFGVVEAIWVGGALGVEVLATASLWLEAMPLLDLGLMFAITFLILPFVPAIFARVLRTRPLPEGRLRSSLERAAERIQLRYREIVLWPTNGRVINAMVVGFTPRSRRIFLTDGIIRALPEDELLAVFFHEAGHAKRHHLPLFLVMFFSVSLFFQAASASFVEIGVSGLLVALLHLGIIWFVILGWVSRKFEREADLYGAEHADLFTPNAEPLTVPGLARVLPNGAALMIRALARVRQVAGRGASHRHGSIDERMAYVAAHATDPAVRESFRRNKRSLLLGIAGVAALSILVTISQLPGELTQARASIAFQQALAAGTAAQALEEDERNAEARQRWEDALTGFVSAAERLAGREDRPSRGLAVTAWFNAGDTALHGLRDAERAKRHFEHALALIREGPALDAEFLRFQIHIELGRIAIWQGETEAVAREHLQAALGNPVVRGERAESDEAREYYQARLRLLDYTITSHASDPVAARMAREKLAALTTGTATGERWVELREDARRELAALEPLPESPPDEDEPKR